MDVTDHTSFLSSSNLDLFSSGKNSDVTLVVQDEKIPVHRLILATKSEFFEVLFYDNQFKESDESEITIDAPVEALRHILQYMYTGILRLTEISTENLLDILELSRRFGLEALEMDLTESLGQRINDENLVDVIRAAEILDSEKLIKKCWEKISGEFFISQSFLSLKFDEIVYFFAHKNETLSVLSVFEAISGWLLANTECQEKEKLLDAIDLSELSNDQLLDIVRPTQLLPPDKLLDLIALRRDEVLWFEKSEIEPGETENLSEDVEVIAGVNPKNAFGTVAFTTGIRINSDWVIDFDLKDIKTFNHLSFFIGDPKPRVYSLHFSNDLKLWSFWKTFPLCIRHQDVYTPPVTARYIRLKGVRYLNTFKVFNETVTPTISSLGFISPSENVCTHDRAFVVGRPGDQLLNGNFENRGVATPYTEVPTEGIEIRFNQPYLLAKFKLRLWDFDDRQVSFRMSRIGINNRSSILRKFELADGWQIFRIPQGENSSGIKIVPAKEQSTAVRLVHIEASF